MKKIVGLLLGAALAVSAITGCAPGQNTGGATAVGAVTGGVLGGVIGGGSGAGIVAGALVGGTLGYLVGRQMDEQDRANMRGAIFNTPVDSDARWTNRRTEITYVVRPVRQYRERRAVCRVYKTKVRVNGRWRTDKLRRACRYPNGTVRVYEYRRDY